MEHPAATLHCPNIRCQAPNPQSNKFCQKCRTPLLRRYLWAIGQGIEAYQPGDIIADRYVLAHSSVLLDTKPGMPPDTPLDIPKGMMPYLRLSTYGLHIPQVYGCITPSEGNRRSQIWLLEEAPLYTTSGLGENKAVDAQGQLLPELTSAWKDASGMRQLNWLWQVANLWQPLSTEGVASSLLTPALLRVEGSIVRLLELQPDNNQTPTLQQLEKLWSQLLPEASPDIAEFLQQLCSQLKDRRIQTSDALVAVLDGGLKEGGRSLIRTYKIFTYTDKGPSRNHNEDACYPPSGQLLSPSSDASALAIVCDGIGGHEGGEVASHLAIDTLRERVERLPARPDNWNPAILTEELEYAACAANDVISQQNDREHRSDRQRMGTTLVMARTCAHEMYITHVGDSRVYWITRNNCHQVTQDDDLASREVRLGYALYRYAVQQPTSGSLVQALGMAPSSTLHPTVQRFVLDEDCVFLLCSDGLSDNDRVDQYWQTEILPILDGQVDLTTAGSRLVEIANRQNGHDNATIALVYCKVMSSNESRQTELPMSQTQELSTNSAQGVPTTTLAGAAPSRMKTQQLPVSRSPRRPWGLVAGIFFLLGMGGVLAAVWFGWAEQLLSIVSNRGGKSVVTSSTPQPASPSSPASPGSSPDGVSSLETRNLIQVSDPNPTNADGRPIRLVLRDGLPPQNNLVIGLIPTGSILQVINESEDRQWLELRVCSPGTGNSEVQQPAPVTPSPERPQSQVGKSPERPIPQPTSASYSPVKQGVSGWIRKGDILPNIALNFTPTPAQQSECATPTSSPTSTPPPIQSPSPTNAQPSS